MRTLFSFVGGNGHFEPLVPIARAAVAAGHPVAFIAQYSMADTVREAGFPVFAVGEAPSQPPARQPLAAPDMEYELRRTGPAAGSRAESPWAASGPRARAAGLP